MVLLETLKTRAQEMRVWLFQDAHKQRARAMKHQVERAFNAHPETTGETYLQHLWFTVRMGGRFVYASMVLTLHGIFPFLCTRTASSQIEKIYTIMRSRIPQDRRDEINHTHPDDGM